MIELVCAVVFSKGILRDVPRGELRAVSHEAMGIAWYPAPYVVFPCIMTDMEAYRFYARHDPQLNGDYEGELGKMPQ